MATKTDISGPAAEQLPTALRISEKLRGFIDWTGRYASWLFLPIIAITVIDVVARKLGWLQIWLVGTFGRMFESTLMQELEWHFHTALFTLVLGYGYIWNSHVRVDLVREKLAFRKKVWLEFIGLTFFMIPFCAIVIWFAYTYAYDSWAINEISASQVGLPYRFIIKGVLLVGLMLALIAGVAVWLQVAVLLWGPQDLRFDLMTLEWPEEAGMTIEGKRRVELDESQDLDRLRETAIKHAE